jgi:hypothetical protein
MTWQTEWRALAARINSLISASEMCLRHVIDSAGGETSLGKARRSLTANIQDIHQRLKSMVVDSSQQMPHATRSAIDR